MSASSEPGSHDYRRLGGRPPARGGRPRPAWPSFWLAVAIAAAVSAGFVLWVTFKLGGTGLTQAMDDIVEAVAALVAAVACLHAARSAQGRGRAGRIALRRAWTLLGLGALAWGLGELAWCWYELVVGREVPFPSAADIGFLAAVPFTAAGVLAFPTVPARAATRLRVVLDGLLIAASLLAVSWATVLGPVYRESASSMLERVVGLAYPIGDIVTGTAVLVALTRSRRGLVPLSLIAASQLALAVANMSFAYLNQMDSYGSGSLLDTGWVVGWLLLAVAALRPMPPEPVAPVDEPDSSARLALPYIPLAAAILTIAVQRITSGPLDAFLLLNGAVIVLLVMLRQLVTLLHNRQLNAKLERAVAELQQREAELKHALDREQAAVGRLRAADDMKDTFLHAVSHDLRSPLTAILGLALTLQRARRDLPEDRVANLLGMLVARARKLDRLLSDLLDLDRLDQGVLEPRRAPTDLGDLVRRVVAEVDGLEGHPLHVDVDPVVALVDGPKIERILDNLLANAAKHTPASTPIWIVAAAQGPHLELTVEDAGPGVPPELAGSIFERFRQGPNAPAHAPGVGIGLSLVTRFAELHGGRAWVADRSGGGASFHVLLPDAAQSPGRAGAGGGDPGAATLHGALQD